MSGAVIVYSEHDEIALELISAGRALADSTGRPLTAIAGGAGAEKRARDMIAGGAGDALTFAESDAIVDSDLKVAALHAASEELRPSVILIGATTPGAEVAARLAQRLRAGCASDCTGLAFENGKLLVERRVLGRFVGRQIVESSPAVATVQPRRFPAAALEGGREGPVRHLEVAAPPARVRVTGARERERTGVRIDKAEVVVAVGRGLRSREDLPMIGELARALGGVVAASRPLTDDLGWLPSDVKVGLSGASVRPRLYIACGISGQIEHSVGMRESGIVVAINSNPGAPIMDQADYRVAADLYDLVPELTRAVLEYS